MGLISMLKELFCGKEMSQLKVDLESKDIEIKNLNKEVIKLIQENEELSQIIVDIRDENINLKLEIKKFKEEDLSLPGEIFESNNVLRGNVLVWTKQKIYLKKLEKLQDYFISGPIIQTLVKDAGIKNNMIDFNKFTKCLNYVQNNFSYMYDIDKFDENDVWEDSINLIITKKADCETLSKLVVEMCRMSGVPADKIFMGIGTFSSSTDSFGHAFVMFYDEEIWWIGEATLPKATSPTTWESVKNNYIVNYGIGNDKFSGLFLGGGLFDKIKKTE